MQLLKFVWDPSKGIDLGFFTIHYYSLMWVLAFLVGLYLIKKIFERENASQKAHDSIFVYGAVGILLGARLGHVLFYQRELITEDFFSIFLPFSFKGGFEFTGFQGMASHGAAIGMILSMFLFSKRVVKKNVLWILDRVVIPVAIGGVFLRLGNFINSEIIGKYTGTSFGVVYKKLGETAPRYPTQLYEGGCYLLVFILLYYIYWKTPKYKQLGYIFGLYLTLLWSIRFVIEFWKEPQGEEYLTVYGLNTGQLLSIPLILTGLYLMFFYKSKSSASLP